MAKLDNAKILFNEIIDKNKKAFDATCNIQVKLLMNKRKLEKAIRSNDGKTYTFYYKATIRMHDLIVDEHNRLVEVVDISNIIKNENIDYEYKVVSVEPYVNQAGIISLSSKIKAADNGKIIIQSGGDVNISNSSISNENKIILSILQDVNLNSAWVAAKYDLYQLFDYEKYIDMVDAIDRHFNGEDIKKAKFEKFIERAKGIAGVLGTFIGAILAEIVNGLK